jgi:hypothetical protein
VTQSGPGWTYEQALDAVRLGGPGSGRFQAVVGYGRLAASHERAMPIHTVPRPLCATDTWSLSRPGANDASRKVLFREPLLVASGGHQMLQARHPFSRSPVEVYGHQRPLTFVAKRGVFRHRDPGDQGRITRTRDLPDQRQCRRRHRLSCRDLFQPRSTRPVTPSCLAQCAQQKILPFCSTP